MKFWEIMKANKGLVKKVGLGIAAIGGLIVVSLALKQPVDDELEECYGCEPEIEGTDSVIDAE